MCNPSIDLAFLASVCINDGITKISRVFENFLLCGIAHARIFEMYL